MPTPHDVGIASAVVVPWVAALLRRCEPMDPTCNPMGPRRSHARRRSNVLLRPHRLQRSHGQRPPMGGGGHPWAVAATHGLRRPHGGDNLTPMCKSSEAD